MFRNQNYLKNPFPYVNVPVLQNSSSRISRASYDQVMIRLGHMINDSPRDKLPIEIIFQELTAYSRVV